MYVREGRGGGLGGAADEEEDGSFGQEGATGMALALRGKTMGVQRVSGQGPECPSVASSWCRNRKPGHPAIKPFVCWCRDEEETGANGVLVGHRVEHEF
jgi:hypothetical protein